MKVSVNSFSGISSRCSLSERNSAGGLHPFGRDIGVAVGDTLIVVEQFGPNAFQLGIDIPCFGTLTGGLVRGRIPQGERDSQARRYESAFAVDRKPDTDHRDRPSFARCLLT